jgi:mannose/fructose-specific phosphotransferase system component IIA
MTMSKKAREIASAIQDVDSGDGAIILTDLFGGTPSNLAISLMQAGRVEVIAGINLPMLIRLAGARKSADVWARWPPRAMRGAITSRSRPNFWARTPESRKSGWVHVGSTGNR